MRNTTRTFALTFLSFACVVCSLGTLPSCSTASAVPPDAPPDASTVPKNPAGAFSVTSSLDFQSVPPPAQALLDELAAATDDPDDPALYLCQRLIAELPPEYQAVASAAADIVAPYLESKLDSFAPSFASGIRALAAGLADAMHHMRTFETLAIEPSGYATRTITGVSLAGASIDFASDSLPDAIASTTVALDTQGNLQIAPHVIALPYGKVIRLAFDRQVIPNVAIDAADLGGALADLVDCTKLGSMLSSELGVGSAALYQAACASAMSALATDVYEQLAAIDATPFDLSGAGAAIGVDDNADGAMDAIADGTWTGNTTYGSIAMPLIGATFTGTR